MRIKIQWKLTLIFGLLTAVALTCVYVYQNSYIRNYIGLRARESLKRDLLLNKTLIETYMENKLDGGSAQDLARRIGVSLRFRVTIITPDGIVIGDSSVASDNLKKLDNHGRRPEIQDALRKGFGQSKRFSATLKKEMLYMAVPLGKKRPIGFLRLSIPVSYLEMTESRVAGDAGVATIFAIFAALLASLAVSLMISRPLLEMSAAARQIASGNFSKKALVNTKDEVGDLARALNEMSDQISAKVGSISYEKAKLETVLESMFEGIMLTDEKGEIQLTNPSLGKLFFIDSSPEGRRPIEVIRNNVVQEIVDKILHEGRPLITVEVMTSIPEEKTIMINGVPIMRNGSVEGAVLVFHDVTELRRLEEIRKDFVANVSHELRTPISSIKGYAETILDGKVDDIETIREFAGIIYQDSNRLANLINDILDLSKLESGKVEMEVASLDVAPVVSRCLSVLDRQAKAKALSIAVDIPKDLPKVMADEKRLAQIFLNLLDNAVKYTPDGGSIKISAHPLKGFNQIDISDTGIGILEKDIPRIFERFYRVDKGRSRELGGTGLGLSIVKHIVQSHNGRIWVQSTPGKGSTFSFTIPQS